LFKLTHYKSLTAKNIKSIYRDLPNIKKSLKGMSEILLANLVMVGEIPAPTFNEERRVEFILDRFREAGLTDCSTDEAGNGIGFLPGTEGEHSILINAHADTVFNEKTDHTMQVNTDTITGPGVADNSLGAALLATIPYIFENLDIKLKNNLVLLAGAKSLGRGDLEGIRFFLNNNSFNLKSAICIEGTELGRLSYSSIGMLRGEITCKVPESYDWTRFGDASAILTLNEVINKINDIRLPKRPRTSIVMGSIVGGTTFNTIALESTLGFEVRSESQEVVDEIGERIEEIGIEVSSKMGDHVNVDIFARRSPGGIEFSDPLTKCARNVMNELGLEPRLAPSISELSAFIDKEIPALTLGLTTGDNLHEKNETIKIEPMYTGITQIIGTILAIDGGYCG
jgi:tripeptide aminopeptidase